MSSQSKEAAFEEWRSVVAICGMRIMKLGGWPGASVAHQRPHTAMARSGGPIGGDASFEERGAASERKLARLAAARSAPPWFVSLTNRHKKVHPGIPGKAALILRKKYSSSRNP